MFCIKKIESSLEKELMSYLKQYKKTTMFMMSNLSNSGLEFHQKPFHGEYFVSFDKNSNINGALAHYWNGNVMMQTDDLVILNALVDAFKAQKTRPIAGILGEDTQAKATMVQLNLEDLPYAINIQEQLFSLNLQQMTFPKQDDLRRYKLKPLIECDQHLIKRWLIDYHIEALGADAHDPSLNEQIEHEIQDIQINQNRWILFVNNNSVSLCGFNARLPDMVQIGPVYTPKNLRNKGYARLGLALCLEQAKSEGAEQAILFTNEQPAIKSYQSIGFQNIGVYRLALLKKPVL
ncbi:TPA: GNAT family N-acetyltransferase [Legionella pneumophila]|uniref:GNAT family N-acetyltransferase n=1 Tax=Legionella pneumophila TaxID=446 RepID=UPI000777146A|nr:GNAT family N-acetyltransferase [Legionella pneumophila]HAT8648939.1 GNAT family N-acetyltransferase [Legionella pneumophila]